MLRAGCAMLALAAAGAAGAADLVRDYFDGLNSFHAKFSQVVVDSNGQQVQDASGVVWMQRPGRFRWDYRTPYEQLIVADGKSIWTYDADLEQATVKPIDEALSSTPAMLLSGFRPLSEVMRWRPLGEKQGKQWYQLDPKQADASVEKVLIGFENRQLDTIEVLDSFGNHTRIRFSDIERNVTPDPARFILQLPPDTDIIGEQP